MTTRKPSISFGAELAASVRAAAADEGRSVSTWLADAAEAKARRRNLRLALDADDQEKGPLSDSEIEELIRQARKTSVITARFASAGF